MIVFDALIGNSDRHHSNWAILRSNDGINFSPLYDNGSSLCCYVKESDIDGILGKDIRRFTSLVTSKSKSRIRIDMCTKRSLNSLMSWYIYSVMKNTENIVCPLWKKLLSE